MYLSNIHVLNFKIEDKQIFYVNITTHALPMSGGI